MWAVVSMGLAWGLTLAFGPMLGLCIGQSSLDEALSLRSSCHSPHLSPGAMLRGPAKTVGVLPLPNSHKTGVLPRTLSEVTIKLSGKLVLALSY